MIYNNIINSNLIKLKRVEKKQIILSLEYCFCIFCFLTLPALLSMGVKGIMQFFVLPSVIAIILIISKTLTIGFKLTPRIVTSILVLGIITTIGYSQYLEGKNYLNDLVNIYFRNLTFFLLALTLICYPIIFSIIETEIKTKKYKGLINKFFIINTLIIPVVYIVFGSFDPILGTLVTAAQEKSGVAYNNYLDISDRLLFCSLLALSTRRDWVGVLLHVITTVFLFLIGSRTPSFVALVTVSIVIFVLLYKSSVISLTKLKVPLSVKKNWAKSVSIFSLTFLFLLLVYTLSPRPFTDNYLDRLTGILKWQNIESSRVYRSVILADTSKDQSFKLRYKLFECFQKNHLSDVTKIFFGGPSGLGCGNSYIHSTLSIMVEYGLLGFSIYLWIVYISISNMWKQAKKYDLALLYKLLLLISFLFIGFSSRNGVSLTLPAVAFGYSSAITFSLGYSRVFIVK